MPTSRIPTWLTILRFSPIVIQLIDDIFAELRSKDDIPDQKSDVDSKEKIVIPPPLVED